MAALGDTRRAASRGLRGAGTEVAALAAHAALYPLGVRPERPVGPAGPTRVDDLAPQHRALVLDSADAVATPVLLVHGMVDNRSIFTLLRRSLRRCGFGHVRTVNYSVFTTDVRAAAAALGRAVEDTCAATGHDRVHVVAHSLGGVAARYYVQRLGGDERVRTLVTLGTPHGGTGSARLVPLRLCRQLRPGSDLMTELAAPAPGCRTRFVAVWSDLDQVIRPVSSARLEHPDLHCRNVLVHGIGHLSLPFARPVAYEVALALTPEASEGRKLAS